MQKFKKHGTKRLGKEHFFILRELKQGRGSVPSAHGCMRVGELVFLFTYMHVLTNIHKTAIDWKISKKF